MRELGLVISRNVCNVPSLRVMSDFTIRR